MTPSSTGQMVRSSGLKRFVTALVATAAMTGALPSSASAQTQQEGLVNVAVENVVVQVPVAVAANICDVNVAVLAEVADDAAACEATADATATRGPNGDAKPVRQEGLVNVLLADILVQVPVAVAANVCDVNVAVLAKLDDDAEACEADASSLATRGPGAGGRKASSQTFDPVGIAGATALDNDLTDDGGLGDVVGSGTVLDPSNPGGLIFL